MSKRLNLFMATALAAFAITSRIAVLSATAETTINVGGTPIYPLTDAKGDVAMITIADVLQSNGIIHEVDKVLLAL